PGVARQELADREAVGGPMPLEVVQELVPALQAVAVHIALRERESMVDAHDDRRLASDLGGQPLGQLAAAPKAVFVGRIAVDVRLVILLGGEDPELRNAVAGTFPSRIVNTDVLLEVGHESSPG